MKTFTNTLTSFKELTLLSLVALMLLGASYANGQFVNPGSNPPSGNVDAPLHTGPDEQTKEGDLVLANSYPWIELAETDEDAGSRIVNSSNVMYLQANRGTIAAPTWETALRLNSADHSGGKYALVNGEMRASEYCDENGNNCLDVAASTAETDPQVGSLNAGEWCRASNDGQRVVCVEDEPFQSCSRRHVTLDDSSWQTQSISRTANCNAGEYVTGGSCYTNNTAITIDFSPDTTSWRCVKPAGHDADGFFRVTANCCS